MLTDKRSPACACGARILGDPDTRVIRRFEPVIEVERQVLPDLRLALGVDCETTGLQAHDEIIELAVRPATYRPSDGTIVGVHSARMTLRQW